MLIQQPDYQAARKYCNKLEERLKKEGGQTVTNCHRLKMKAELIFTALAELSTRQIAESTKAAGMKKGWRA